MATSGCRSAACAAALVAVLTVLTATGVAGVSANITVFDGPGCTGIARLTLSALGVCHNITVPAGGGLHVSSPADGALALLLHTSPRCAGVPLVGTSAGILGNITRAVGDLISGIGGILRGGTGVATDGLAICTIEQAIWSVIPVQGGNGRK